MKKREQVNAISELSGSAIGAAVGFGIGSVAVGPVGAMGGAVAGELVEKVFSWAGTEISNRLLSKRETKRVTTVMELAKQKIQSNLTDGKKLRDDEFFDKDNDRSTAEEILEGTLFAAQKEYEERKLPYVANLYANIAFDKEINREMADKLIKLSVDLTYRQLIIINVLGFAQSTGAKRKMDAYKEVNGANNVSIASEIFELYIKSVIFSSEAIVDAAGVNPSKLQLSGYGAWLYNLMELAKMPLSDNCTADIVKFLGME